MTTVRSILVASATSAVALMTLGVSGAGAAPHPTLTHLLGHSDGGTPSGIAALQNQPALSKTTAVIGRVAKVAGSSLKLPAAPLPATVTTPSKTVAVAGASLENLAALLGLDLLPTVLLYPSDQLVSDGGPAIFTTSASGSPMPTVQWQVATHGGTHFVDIADATSTTLLLTRTTASELGNRYRAVFTNIAGSDTSPWATLR